MSTFAEIRAQVLALLQQEGRLSYRVLKRSLGLEDDDIEDLKADLIDAKRLAVDEEGKVLVWVGAAPVSRSMSQLSSPTQSPTLNTQPPSGERRQLTVQFIDLNRTTQHSYTQAASCEVTAGGAAACNASSAAVTSGV